MKTAATIGKVNEPCCIRQTITAPMTVMIMTATRSIRVIRPIIRPLVDIQRAYYFVVTFRLLGIYPASNLAQTLLTQLRDLLAFWISINHLSLPSILMSHISAVAHVHGQKIRRGPLSSCQSYRLLKPCSICTHLACSRFPVPARLPRVVAHKSPAR
jgi:hypothetical protein